MQTLSGRTAVFAGATGGDGRETVKALCAGGMNVIMMTHNSSAAAALSAEIKELRLPGTCAYYVGGDGKAAAEEDGSLYAEIAERFGSVDVIIANTGANGKIDDIETLDPEDLKNALDHLAVGAYRMLRTALPYLKQSKAPRVIFMTTADGVRGGTQESFANAIAKGAVEALTLNSAARLAPLGISVNCIAKGAIARIEEIGPGEPDPADRLVSIPMGRLGTPFDLAGAISFLASEEAAYITGQILELSGGLNLGR